MNNLRVFFSKIHQNVTADYNTERFKHAKMVINFNSVQFIFKLKSFKKSQVFSLNFPMKNLMLQNI